MGAERTTDRATRWTLAELRRRLTGLGRAERGAEKAPHKPLTVLAALGHLQRTDSAARFRELEPVVRRLLRDFGGACWDENVRDPVWYLRNEDVWQVSDPSSLEMERAKPRPRIASLRAVNPVTFFRDDVCAALRTHPEWTAALARDVMDAYFSPTLHEGIATAAGLVAAPRRLERTALARDAAFPRDVLDAYERTCALCGLDAALDGGGPLGIQAAHVMWHCAGGPSTVENAVALCATHHVALDLGAVGISTDRRILVSSHVRGGSPTDDVLRRWSGRPYRLPANGTTVGERFIRWHTTQRFRAPALPSVQA